MSQSNFSSIVFRQITPIFISVATLEAHLISRVKYRIPALAVLIRESLFPKHLWPKLQLSFWLCPSQKWSRLNCRVLIPFLSPDSSEYKWKFKYIYVRQHFTFEWTHFSRLEFLGRANQVTGLHQNYMIVQCDELGLTQPTSNMVESRWKYPVMFSNCFLSRSCSSRTLFLFFLASWIESFSLSSSSSFLEYIRFIIHSHTCLSSFTRYLLIFL